MVKTLRFGNLLLQASSSRMIRSSSSNGGVRLLSSLRKSVLQNTSSSSTRGLASRSTDPDYSLFVTNEDGDVVNPNLPVEDDSEEVQPFHGFHLSFRDAAKEASKFRNEANKAFKEWCIKHGKTFSSKKERRDEFFLFCDKYPPSSYSEGRHLDDE